jgi:hypothetical protein
MKALTERGGRGCSKLCSWELFVSEEGQPVQYFFPMAAIGISYNNPLKGFFGRRREPGSRELKEKYELFVASRANLCQAKPSRQRGGAAPLWLHT